MEGNTRRETGVPSASAPYSPAPALTRLDHSTSAWGRRSRSGGRPGARSGAVAGGTSAARERHTSRTPRVQLAWEASTLGIPANADTRVSQPREAVAQTPGELAGSVLRVGSETRQVVRHAPPASHDVAPLNRSGTDFREHAAPFPKRLYATASRESTSENSREFKRRSGPLGPLVSAGEARRRRAVGATSPPACPRRPRGDVLRPRLGAT
jgi:hypothetical protein